MKALIFLSYTQHCNLFFLHLLPSRSPYSLSQAFEQTLFIFKHKNVWVDTYKSVAAIQRVVLGAGACRNIFELEQTDLQLSVPDSRCKCFQKETSPFALT